MILNKEKLTKKLDVLGATTSLICALHCGFLPFFISFFSLGFGLGGHNHIIDLFFILIGVVSATISFYLGYKNHHKSFLPLKMSIVGFVIIIGNILLHFEQPFFFIFSLFGAFLITFSHYKNWKLCKNCKRCMKIKN